MAFAKRQRFQGLATLELAKNTREHRPEHLRGDGVKDCAHVHVARDPLDPIDRMQIALRALLVKGPGAHPLK